MTCQCNGQCHQNTNETEQTNTIRNWLDDALPPVPHLVDEPITRIRRDAWRKTAGTAPAGAWL